MITVASERKLKIIILKCSNLDGGVKSFIVFLIVCCAFDFLVYYRIILFLSLFFSTAEFAIRSDCP